MLPGKLLALVTALFAGLSPVLSYADTIATSYTGTFSADNDVQLFDLVIGGDGATVSIQTWSYGGGTNAAGTLIAPGGFAPELSVFDPSGDLIALDATGGTVPDCNGRNTDPITGFCFDALIYDSSHPPLTLGPGDYTVSLTEQGNNPVGTLSDGFSEDANNGDDPTFTGDDAGLPGEMFIDPGDFTQRTDEWALDMTVATIPSVPEPESAALFLAGCLTLGLIRTRRRRCLRGTSTARSNTR